MKTQLDVTHLNSLMPIIIGDQQIASLFASAETLSHVDVNYFIGGFVSHLRESVYFDKAIILQEYIGWSCSTLVSRGLSDEIFYAALERMAEMVATFFPPNEYPTIEKILEETAGFRIAEVQTLPSLIDRNNSWGAHAGEYLDLLLAKNKHEALSLISNLYKDGLSLADIYQNILQVALAEIGRLWQYNKISVLQEHFVTSSTSVILNMLFPHAVLTEKKGKSILAICIGEEQHEIGIRMVADMFEIHGWDSYLVGANTPVEAIVNNIEQYSPDVLAISVTGMQFFSRLKQTIEKLDVWIKKHNLFILVGGYAFDRIPAMYRSVGAHAYAATASEALNSIV